MHNERVTWQLQNYVNILHFLVKSQKLAKPDVTVMAHSHLMLETVMFATAFFF